MVTALHMWAKPWACCARRSSAAAEVPHIEEDAFISRVLLGTICFLVFKNSLKWNLGVGICLTRSARLQGFLVTGLASHFRLTLSYLF